MLNTSPPLAPAHLWRVVSSFHMGEFVKGIFESRHINASSVAKEMGVKTTSMPSYFNSKTITEDVLVRMSNALKFDLLGMVRAEQARRQAGPGIGATSDNDAHDLADPGVKYEARPSGAPKKGLTLMIDLEEYPVESQLRILNYINQQEKRGGSARAAGR